MAFGCVKIGVVRGGARWNGGSNAMSPRGRKPTPDRVKKITGNPGKRKSKATGAKPVAERLAVPELIAGTPAAVAEFERVQAALPAGTLWKIDAAVLTAYCQAWAGWCAASARIAKEGRIVSTPNSHRQANPNVALERQYRADCVAFARVLGFAPSERARLMIPPEETAEEKKARSIFGS